MGVGGGRSCWGHAACAGPAHCPPPLYVTKPSGWQRRQSRHGRHSEFGWTASEWGGNSRRWVLHHDPGEARLCHRWVVDSRSWCRHHPDFHLLGARTMLFPKAVSLRVQKSTKQRATLQRKWLGSGEPLLLGASPKLAPSTWDP